MEALGSFFRSFPETTLEKLITYVYEDVLLIVAKSYKFKWFFIPLGVAPSNVVFVISAMQYEKNCI